MSNIRQEEQHHLTKTIDILDEMIKESKHNDKFSKARRDLYFGRLDYVEDGMETSIYIGKTGAVKDDTELIIVDWRSSIGEVYNLFNGGTRQLEYSNPSGFPIKVMVQQKRQIQIANDQVLEVNLVGKPGSNNEDFLLKALDKKGQAHQVKDIISTLQEEQDRIVRHDMTKTMLVQGVAGSGKSSIALHRISYLLYRNRNWMKPNNVMILGPNKMFLSYMRKVAPELEIQDVQHDTFMEWTCNRLGLKHEVEEPYQVLSQIINGTVQLEEIELVMLFKGSMEFKSLIDHYIETEVLQNLLPKQDLSVGDHSATLEHRQLRKLFDSKVTPINKRLEEVRTYVKEWLKKEETTALRRIEQNYENAVHQFVYNLPEDSKLRKQAASALEQSYYYLRKRTEREFDDAGKHYLNKFKQQSPMQIYEGLFSQTVLQTLGHDWREEFIEKLGRSYWNRHQRWSLGYDDLAPMLYLEKLLNGLEEEYDYLVIDEAQDLSPFQIFMLKQLTKSMTILGDVSQSIYSFSGTSDWDDLFPDVYEAEQMHRIEINTSYRSTLEIINLANLILHNSPLKVHQSIPISRKGALPKIERVNSAPELEIKILASLAEFSTKDYTKIAIICKDEFQTQGLYNYLVEQKQDSVQLILDSTHELNGRIVVIPSYLVKGLEFDAVILPNVSQDRFTDSSLDSRLLYICVTRANHEVHMYYHQNPSPLLDGAMMQADDKSSLDKFGIL